MKILFDTNILIDLETTGRTLPVSYSDMVRIAREQHYDIVYHPSQKDDLMRDKDLKRREAHLSRILQYSEIQSPPVPSVSDLEKLGWNQGNDNDRVDNLLLFALCRGAVSYLITEDKGIHAKARSCSLGKLVFNVEDFLSLLRGVQDKVEYSTSDAYVSVEPTFLHNIDVNDEFFDSLRKGYDGFNTWYRKSAESGRQAWIVKRDGEIEALCIFKEEFNEAITSTNDVLCGKLLKLCTLKVAALGKKYGERLLFVAFNYAIRNHYDFVYIQVREDTHNYLVALLTDFGFKKKGPYKNDTTYVKDMCVGERKGSIDRYDYVRYAIEHYPHVNTQGVKKFIVPIRPSYHDRLFPDLSFARELFCTNLPSESNAIKKAYLCKNQSKKIKPGDILLFYRSTDAQSIQCVGIVERVKRSDDANEIIAFVSKRTVFSHNEIRKMTTDGSVLVILFRVIRYLQEPVDRKTLALNGVVGALQTIREIREKTYRKLFQKEIDK